MELHSDEPKDSEAHSAQARLKHSESACGAASRRTWCPARRSVV